LRDAGWHVESALCVIDRTRGDQTPVDEAQLRLVSRFVEADPSREPQGRLSMSVSDADIMARPSGVRRTGLMMMRVLSLLCLSVLAGGAFGVFVLLLNNGVAGGWRIPGIVLESRLAWCAAPFFAGVAARTRLRACAAGLVVELVALLAYYVARHVIAAEPWDQVWPEFRALADLGVLIGPLFGLLGSFAISGGPWRHVWRMAIPGLAAVEASVNLVFAGSDRLSHDVSVAELVLSCAIVVGFAIAFVRALETSPGWMGRCRMR
jgi:hypothetical protein